MTIAYLVLHSRFAADRVLNRLYDNETLRDNGTVNYLKGMGITRSPYCYEAAR